MQIKKKPIQDYTRKSIKHAIKVLTTNSFNVILLNLNNEGYQRAVFSDISM